jgi:predicted unusual protein kinase regulating ubiquinone biosynthesis (AarF/ABC1/UbiB family)
MTASVAGGFARNQLGSAFRSSEKKALLQEEYFRKAGLRLAETLGELKGAAMKLGQMASTNTDFLPPEVAEALAALQKEAPPMDFEVIEEMITAEFGEAPERLFRSLHPEPYAAASIGQVHRAVTDDGREVVVKVQYPGVDEAIDSDLKQLGRALKMARIATDKRGLDALMTELSDRLHEELDYCNEADNMRLFAAIHADDPLVVVPEVVGERSSQRVLTMIYEPGDPWSALASSPYTPDERDRFAARIVELLARQVWGHGVLHGDPNPANFVVRRDGTIVMYDFGCIRRYSERTRQAFADMLRGTIGRDPALIDDALIRIGTRDPKHKSPGETFWKGWLDLVEPPFTASRVYDFGKEHLDYKDMMKLVPQMMRDVGAFRPDAEIPIAKRVVTGWYDSFRAVGARISVGRILEPWIE